MKQKLLLLGLNEINFEYIERYIQQGLLPNFKKLFEEHGYIQTTSENEYKLWEPWIQWVTIHTGKPYSEHNIFRLGDIVKHGELEQLWEIAEKKGYTTGAVSPFNAKNSLNNAHFFIPDPWTKTSSSGSKLVKDLAGAVSQAVNDNAHSKVTTSSIKALLQSYISYVPVKRYPSYMKRLSQIKSGVGTKAIFLDEFLGDVFHTLWNRYKPDFSSLFLNAGAHIQHHYMFNASVYDGDQKNPDWYVKKGDDPLRKILIAYDHILQQLVSTNARIFIATGLHQRPHTHTTFYWRLKDHKSFLSKIGINQFTELLPRMSRDFLVEFATAQEASDATNKLENVVASDGEKVFEVDERDNSLFVELIYPNNIDENLSVKGLNGNEIKFLPEVSFVAIKNGEHDGVGYFIDTAKKFNKQDSIPLTNVFEQIVAAL